MENSKKHIKIAVVGPECTGKSAMSAYLAKQLNTIWVPEFSREYCANLTQPCSLQDEINIFKGQIALEKEMLSTAPQIVICDTTFLTVKIWSDYVFKQTPTQVLAALQTQHQYDYFLLMNIDLPWENDPLRDFPNEKLRLHFLNVWTQELSNLNASFSLISGIGEERFNNGLQAVELFLGKHSLDF